MTLSQEIVRKLWMVGMSDVSIAAAIGASRSSIINIRHLKQSGKLLQPKLIKLWMINGSMI